MVSYLLKSGADPTLPDAGLRTCMHHAVMGQSPECIQELLKHKVGWAGWLGAVCHIIVVIGRQLSKQLTTARAAGCDDVSLIVTLNWIT